MRFPYLLSRRSLLSALACSLWLLFWLPAAVWAGGFALQINDESGLDEPWPLVAGLPFPEGALRDAEQIRILDATGAQVPAQMDVAATWRDGSLRWVQAGFTASPQGAYRVEYGEHVYGSGAATTDAGLRVYEHADGLTVDTGAAVYEFLGDRLLPETARMGGTEFLSGSGDGAYLVDNQGRLARVAGAAAEVTSTIVKQGPSRAVLRREGWYVTESGERVARTQAWFYFAAGTPYLRVTHSLIFTEDTNDLWVRDYGLAFRTPGPPSEALFALGDDSEFGASLLSMRPVAASGRKLVPVDGDEVFMLQDDFPHFRERESRAVVGRATPLYLDGGGIHRANLDYYEVLQSAGAVGDWADGKFGSYGLTLVMPWLAQRFPKDLAFGPDGARAAFWSGRSGRELDFRAATLIDEYWQSWADLAPEGREALAQVPSNAQGAARTHDLWLLPRMEPGERYWREARAKAASQPPLVLADPAWLTGTEAMGWPIHPLDTENFPREEEVLSNFWDKLMVRHESGRRTGFIAFGDHPQIRHMNNAWRRTLGQYDYGLRRTIWSLYARSGDRRYYDYATRSNRFFGDWIMAHENTPDKYIGGTAVGYSYDHPLYWGVSSALRPNADSTGYDAVQWLFDYYLNGDERSLESIRMFGEAYKAHWEAEKSNAQNRDGIFTILRAMASLYSIEWDEDFFAMAQEHAQLIIDLDNSPNGINDELSRGSHYKADRDMLGMYHYYRETGDQLGREAFLRGVDYKYRFNRVGGAFDNQAYTGFLFAVAYRWTGNHDYLRVLHQIAHEFRLYFGERASIDRLLNPFMGMPTALGLLAEAGDTPVTAFPLVRQFTDQLDSKILIRKLEGQSVDVRVHLRILNELDENSVTAVSVHDPNDSPVSVLNLESETMFETQYEPRVDLRRRFVSFTIPASEPAGLYTVEFPGAWFVDVLDADASQVYVYAPEGHRLSAYKMDYFWVPEGTETLKLSLSDKTSLRRPDGTEALGPSSSNIGTQNISVGDHAGVWSLIAAQSSTVRLLNVEPIFSREPQYVVPWSEPSLDESDGSLDGSEDPLAGSEDPLAGSEDPLAGSEDPLAGSEDPLAGSEDPLAGSEDPLAGSEDPLDGSEDPLDGSDAPPAAPLLEVSLARTDMRPRSE